MTANGNGQVHFDDPEPSPLSAIERSFPQKVHISTPTQVKPRPPEDNDPWMTLTTRPSRSTRRRRNASAKRNEKARKAELAAKRANKKAGPLKLGAKRAMD
ncbi:hypothetical protein TCAL_16769 [Tigriopus californicus]|uniref:Uncharacterized protein n=1 Tax=Tigriopus californicus TaxID=6832 RepID=A0A553PSK5_TIGCA|nr:hypothetical protein TCAL_16769 [Tigriopus californicus]